jgi:hypothetical protein
MRMRLRHRVALAAVLASAGAAVVAGVASPASAADVTPTISAPATATGYSTIRITGGATPGATVELYESAYVFHDLQPAKAWATTGLPVTAVAAANGTYRIDRWIDTGFLLAVRVNGVMSRTALVSVRLAPILTVTSTKHGKVTAKMSATPAQPFIPVRIERRTTKGTWAMVAHGWTNNPGAYSVTVAKQTSGKTYTYRAWAGGDTESALLAAYSATHRAKIK